MLPAVIEDNATCISALHPFDSDCKIVHVVPGTTVQQIVDEAVKDPVLVNHLLVRIGDDIIPREQWSRVRLKKGAVLHLKVIPTGDAKDILRTLLSIVVVVGAIYLAPLIVGAEASAAILALTQGLLSAVGMLLVNALIPPRPPALPAGPDGQAASEIAQIETARNRADLWGPVPVVLGKHRVVPRLGARTYTEIIGQDQYLRMILIFGYGKMSISDIRIGETPLSEFDDVETEIKYGTDSDNTFENFASDPWEESLNIKLTKADSWQTRTTQPNADELSVDIMFPKGLFQVDDQGNKKGRRVRVIVQYRPVTASGAAWQKISYASVWGGGTGKSNIPKPHVETDGDDVTALSINRKRQEAMRFGVRWPVDRGQYEIRMRRQTYDVDKDDEHIIFDEVYWTAIRRFTNEDPVNFAHPMGSMSLVIKATDQLNGVVDELNALCALWCDDWDGYDWVEAATQNPTSLYLWVLRGPANPLPVDDDAIDWDTMQEWHEENTDKGYKCNFVIDYNTSIPEVLSFIAATGRATPTFRDGKWSVIMDKEQTIPVNHFTPRNTWGFKASKPSARLPHAFRVRFINEDEDYRQDERIVYDDGYTSANSEIYEGIEFPGITDPELIWKFGRFHIASARLRPESYTFNCGIDHLIGGRGSLALLSHDVMLVGLGSSRIKDMTKNGDGDVTVIEIDEAFDMKEGESYGISIRTPDDCKVLATVNNDEEETTTLTLTTPIEAALAPEIGDLLAFGKTGLITVDVLIKEIVSGADLTAELTCVPYNAAIYAADQGTIPAFASGVTALEQVPQAVIERVVTDESVLERGPGETLLTRAKIIVAPVDYKGANLEIQGRPSETGENFGPMNVVAATENSLTVSNVNENEFWDFRVRWNDYNRIKPGAWATTYNVKIVGRTSAPAALSNFTLTSFGGQAYLRWNEPPELDVKFGGWIQLRHSPVMSGGSWSESVSIGQAAAARDLKATLPLVEGTYFARVFDSGGRAGGIASVATHQDSMFAFSGLTSIAEETAFSGTHDNTLSSAGVLKLAAVGLVDDIPDIDSVADWDNYGGIAPTGEYLFANSINLGGLYHVRSTLLISATIVNVLDLIDDRTTDIDSWEDFDGTDQAHCDAVVYMRHTADDPSGSPTWSAWHRFDACECHAWAFEFKVVLTSNDPSFNIHIDTLQVLVEEVVL